MLEFGSALPQLVSWKTGSSRTHPATLMENFLSFFFETVPNGVLLLVNIAYMFYPVSYFMKIVLQIMVLISWKGTQNFN